METELNQAKKETSQTAEAHQFTVKEHARQVKESLNSKSGVEKQLSESLTFEKSKVSDLEKEIKKLT